ncbi:MAG: FkbM family methyltransferase [Rhodoferax sp.]|uniref:FkbM family methyltransferase n=1 Tax=Rhodoferax sp. TaxID=50421 RepID=UPI002618E952|nr:FkbM family methyltransferase [Rhodoferax sp.]MDD2882224.1 FkbM family methyltransferase [Rhodoferax sp.]
MTFISYSQNREDVMLWRALKHVTPGFYVDVGANDPSDDSVTRAFYERGWSGINVEPLARHIRALQQQRPRDVNLCVAVGASDGDVEIFDTAVRGWATANAEVAQVHRAQGVAVTASRVPLRRLDGIFAEFVAASPVHFLKIDVEGFEAAVLQGMDFARWRPWLVVVEATVPNSQVLDDHWEPLLTQAAYDCVYFDGLNKYYLAHEHPELKAAFAVPPNVFDDYIAAEQVRLQQLADEAKLTQQAAQAEAQLTQQALQAAQAQALADKLRWQHELGGVKTALAAQQEKAGVLAGQVAALQAQLAAVYASTSWRVTRPLRAASRRLLQLRGHASPATVTDLNNKDNKPVALLDKEQGAMNFVYWSSVALRNSAVAFAPELDGTEAAGLPTDTAWRLVGHVEGHYSLAMVNRGLALGLAAMAPERVQMVAYHGQAYTAGNDMPAPEQKRIARLLAHVTPANAPVVSIVHHFPLITDAAPAACRLVMFFWEESVVPADMVAHINTHFDGVLVASLFVRQCLRNSGCTLPVFLVPMGLPHFASVADLAPQVNCPASGQNFRFLHVSSAFARKGIDVLLEAFFARFTGADAVELYIKSFANPHNNLAELVAQFADKFPDGPRVILDHDELDAQQMQALYASAHAMVLPSRGEGFNMPAAEALAMGLPLVVTGFGGQADFANVQNAYMVPYSFALSGSHLHTEGSFWIEPDRESLVQLLGMVRDDVLAQSARLQQQRLAGAQWVRQQCTWANAALATQNAATALLTGAVLKPAARSVRTALLSPWHTSCGIAEHAHALFKAWPQDAALTVFCDMRTPADASQAIYAPHWTLNDCDSVVATLETIAAGNFEVLVVQHQQSLFLLTDEVCAALAQVQASGCVVVLELHSTLPLVRERRISQLAIQHVQTLARVLVHKLDDVNYLLGLGLVDNVMCLPLGVTLAQSDVPKKSVRQGLGLMPDDLVLGCFGFLLPHKGMDRVIGSMPGLAHATGKTVKLLAITAALDERSQQTLAECQTLAQSLGVAQDIIWVTEFLPIEDCLRQLKAVDVMVYAYGPTRESASAAVTVGLATGVPVLVSDQPIFSDVKHCSHVVQNMTAQALVDAVCWLLQHPQELEAQAARQTQWLAHRDWARIGQQFRATVLGLLADQAAAPLVCPVPLPKQRQLLVDVSELYHRNAKTGIQRVVLNILRAWLAQPPAGFVVRPVFSLDGQGFRYTHKFFESLQGQPDAPDEQLVQVAWGDIFLGLDLSAHLFPAAEQTLHQLRLRGVRVCYVVYDIIPLLRPDFSVPGMQQAFANWLQSLRRQADRLVCISEAVAQDVRLWMGGHTEEGAFPDVRAFHLGSDLMQGLAPGAPSATAVTVIARLASQPSCLMVGTLEPRKGYRQVLQAFDLLWRNGSQLVLVIVGKPGWMMDDFCVQLRQHPQAGLLLHWFDDASDAVLESLYDNCSCLLAASEMEGFGLPLIEAARHNLPIVARDIRVFREVAEDHAFYFQGSAPEDLSRALLTWLSLHQQGLAPGSQAMRRLTWQQSADQLLQAIL